MTDLDLVQACLADPTDDAPRLVFSDWLEEHGDDTGVPAATERAELIRLQCELARWIPDLERRTQLQERERELLANHTHEWLGPLIDLCSDWRFDRGLPSVELERASLSWTTRLQTALRQAWVEEVRLRIPERRQGHPDLTPLDGIGALDLDANGLSTARFRGMLDQESLGSVVRLDLGNNNLTDNDIRAFLVAPHLDRLRWLDLRNNRLTTKVVDLLLMGLRDSVQWLDLHGNDLTPEDLVRVAKWRTERGWQSPDRFPHVITNSIGMDLALIPAGTFFMGSPPDERDREEHEGPQHRVTISRPFFLGVYAVTQQEYETVMGTNPAHFTRDNQGAPHYPVENVTWHNAVEFCEHLSRLPAERAARRRYRLPTEAEWEYACRAGTTTPFHFGSDLSPNLANFDGEYPYGAGEPGEFLRHTRRVGSYPPSNAFGLFDVHGNTLEWVADWYQADYYAVSREVDPAGPVEGDRRVQRSGSWFTYGRNCRSARRYLGLPGGTDDVVGFRVVMVQD
jgi:uncharacterized protein (TIGR02996 family)